MDQYPQIFAENIVVIYATFTREIYCTRMARYYFHFRNGDDFVEDEEGLELINAAAARAQGVGALREMLASDVQHGFLDRRCVIEIEDEGHLQIDFIDFDRVLRFIG